MTFKPSVQHRSHAERGSLISALAPAIFLCLWSSGFVFVRMGLNYAEPLTFLMLRYILVVVIMIAVLPVSGPIARISRRQCLDTAVVGLLLQGGYFSATYLSVKCGLTSSNVALVTSQQPVLVGVLAPVLVGERLGRTRWFGMILSVVGTSTVILSYPTDGGITISGLLFAFVALLSITSSTLYEKRYGTNVNPVISNLIQYSLGFIVVGILAVTTENMHIQWSTPFMVSIVYLVVCNSIIAIYLLLAMVRHREASRVSNLFFLVPPLTAVIGFVLLGETLPHMAIPGIMLTGVGVYIAMKR